MSPSLCSPCRLSAFALPMLKQGGSSGSGDARGPLEAGGSGEQKDLESYSKGAWPPTPHQTETNHGRLYPPHPLCFLAWTRTSPPHNQPLPCVGDPPRPTHPRRPVSPRLLRCPWAGMVTAGEAPWRSVGSGEGGGMLSAAFPSLLEPLCSTWP